MKHTTEKVEEFIESVVAQMNSRVCELKKENEILEEKLMLVLEREEDLAQSQLDVLEENSRLSEALNRLKECCKTCDSIASKALEGGG